MSILWDIVGVLVILAAIGLGLGLILFLAAFLSPPWPPKYRKP